MVEFRWVAMYITSALLLLISYRLKRQLDQIVEVPRWIRISVMVGNIVTTLVGASIAFFSTSPWWILGSVALLVYLFSTLSERKTKLHLTKLRHMLEEGRRSPW